MDLIERFEDAGHNGRDLRPLTFWSWNDRLEPEEIRRQVREMAKGGLGGHFMHARLGLATPYLGPDWMAAVHSAVEEGRHTGVAPWLYDEDCWPSGVCSGRVTAGREPFRDKHLVFEEIEHSRWEPQERTVAVYVAKRLAAGYADFRRVDDPHLVCHLKPEADEAVLHFVYRTGDYVDVLCRDATEEFLKRTHEVYRESVGREFGRLIPGIFTDEPCYGWSGHRVPWSLELGRFFQRSCGYDLAGHLPELFFPVGDWRKVRFDFYESLTRLFLLAWTLPVYQWCDRNRLALTGHMMAEDTLRSQVEHIGAAMPHYEYMHIPGIDHLGRRLGSPVLVKQVSSVAAQLGRRRVLSEMFGCAGWNASFDDLRWIAEWQFVLGVNLVCQHLSLFTLRGCRKRDYPPSLHYHQPWWPHYCLFNDYVARLLAVLTQGEAVADVLVVHPSASAWAEFSPLDSRAVDDLDKRLLALVNTVLATHADFHFGDELILERHASVAKGELRVGRGRYRLVIVPDATNLRRSTVQLLARFKRCGGRILFAGRVPQFVDGDASDEVVRLAKRCLRAEPGKGRGRAALR
ncbi:MAG: glycosyl hydrolase, partial [Phycisphaerae bacterium]